MELGGGAPPLRGPRARPSDSEANALVPRGPVSEDVMAAIYDRATAIFSGHKHKVSGMLEPPQGPYALALVGAMLGLNQKQLDAELQLTAKVGRRSLSYEEFMSACEAMVALHGALAQQQVRRLPNNDMSSALRAAFSRYVKLNVGGFVGGDQRMNSQQFVKMCQDAAIMEPNGPASQSTLQLSWASCKATFGSSRLQYNQFLKIIGALAAELSGDVFLLVAGLGLELPTVPPLRNGFRKPDAGEVNLPKPEVLQGVGSHVAAEEAYERYLQDGRAPEKRDPLGRANASPIKGPRTSVNGAGVPNWVKAMQADQGGASPMTSGQDIRGIPVIETPDSDDDMMPRKPARKSVGPVPPDEPTLRTKASPMRPRGGKLPAMGGDALSPPLSPEMVVRSDGSSHGGGPGGGMRVEAGAVQITPRQRESTRNGIISDLDSPIGQLEPSILAAAPRMRKSVAAPEGFREVVEQQAAAVKALEGRVQEQQQREKELFERVQLLTEKLTDAQATAVTVQSGCPGASLPDVPQGRGRKVVSGRCPLTDQVERLTEQMTEVLARLSALESIRMQPKAPNELPPKLRNPVGSRTPVFPDEPAAVVPVAPSWAPPAGGRSPRMPDPDDPRVVSSVEPVLNAAQSEWMSRLLVNLDKRVRLLEGAAGTDNGDSEAMAEVLKQLRGMQSVASPAPPAPPAPGSSGPSSTSPPDPAFLKVDPRRKAEKVADNVDVAPALMPTGDADLDRRLAALANELRGKNATVGVLLDMLNQTRGEVAALAAQLNAARDGGPVLVGPQRSPAPPNNGPSRNPVHVVDGGLVPPEAATPGLVRPRRRTGERGTEGAIPLEHPLEVVMSEQQGIKRVVRELCAAIGVAPPPMLAPAASPDVVITRKASSDTGMINPGQWSQPGRKTIKEETQEVKRDVESVQADVGELKKQVEQIRSGYGFAEWPQPLRPDGSTTTTVVVPGAAPMQAGGPAGGRNPVQVVVGPNGLPADTQGLMAPGRRPLQPMAPGDASVAPLPDAEVNTLKDELRRVKAFVGMAEAAQAPAVAVAAAAAVPAGHEAATEAGKWADAGKGPQPLREAVGTVATDVEALRKHVKAIDGALRTNITNTNNLTTFLNENAPVLMQVAQHAKESGAAGGGRYPLVAAVGEVQPQPQQQQGMPPPPKRGMLPLQSDGTLEGGVVDPVEYQQLRDQVRNIACFLGGPDASGATQASPTPAPTGVTVTAVTEPERVSVQPWTLGGRGGRGSGTVTEELGHVSGEVETLKKQMAQMGHAMRAAGLPDPAVVAVTGNGPEVGGMAARQGGQRNAVNVTAGAPGADGVTGFAPPQHKGQAGLEGMSEVLPPVLARLADDIKRMQAFLGMAPTAAGAEASGPDASRPAGGESRGVAVEPWGAPGREPRQPGDQEGGPRNLGDMTRELETNRHRTAALEEALRAAGIPIPPPAGANGAHVTHVAPSEQQPSPRQRNAVAVTPGLTRQDSAMGFHPPPGRRLLPALEGLPEPAQGELSRMAEDVRRMQAFLGMGPTAFGPGAAAGPNAPGAAGGAAGGEARSVAVEPWGAPGREPRRGSEDAPRNLGDVVKDFDQNTMRMAALEEALRAAGIPVPAAPVATSVAVAGSSEQQARQRNPVNVTAGNMPEGAVGFTPPGRRLLPALEGLPQPAQAELSRLADDIKRMQAFLGMAPTAAGAEATGPDAPGAAGGEARGVAVEPWGAPGREPRQLGDQEGGPRNLGELVRDMDDQGRRMAQMEEALRAAGVPLQGGTTAVGPSSGSEQPQRQRNGVVVSPGLVPSPEAATGFAPLPRRGPGATDGAPELLPAKVEELQGDVRRIKAFLGMQDAPTGAAAAAATEAAKAAGVAAAAEAGPWAGPGRDKSGGASVDAMAKELGDVKQQLEELDRVLRGAGMGYMLPKDGGLEPTAVQQQQRPADAADKNRGAVQVTAGGPQRQLDVAGLPPLARKDGLPPIQNPSFVDANEYGELKNDVDRIKAFMDMKQQGDGQLGAGPPAAAAAAGGVVAAAGNEPWADKALREETEEAKKAVKELSDDLDGLRARLGNMEEALRMMGVPDKALQAGPGATDVRAAARSTPGGTQRNPVTANPGMAPEAASQGFAAPMRQPGDAAVEGLSNPVLVDPEDFQQLKRALEELQGAVGSLSGQQQQPAALDGAKKPKTLREDTDDIKKFVRAMGKDVGAMGNDMQTLKKHMDDVEGAMNRALANMATELARMMAARDAERPESPVERKPSQPRLEAAGKSMEDTINAISALDSAQQQAMARVAADGTRSEDIDALNEAMRQSENQLARLLAFLKQDVMDRFAVHEKTLIRMAKQIDYIQRLLKGEFDEQREAVRESSRSSGAVPD